MKKIITISLLLFGHSNSCFAEFELGTEYLIDNNVYRTVDELSISDKAWLFKPNYQRYIYFGKSHIDFNYESEISKYNENDQLNYDDHNLNFKLLIDSSLRLNTIIEAGYIKEHEDPGAIDRIQYSLDSFNRYDRKDLRITTIYGRDDARGKITASYRTAEINYKNNDLDYLDNDNNQYLIKFNYVVKERLSFQLDALYSKADYVEREEVLLLDNEYHRIRFGLTWAFKEYFSTDFNIGYQSRQYDVEALNDTNGLSYDGNLDWNISQNSKFSILASRESVESSQENIGGFLRTSYSVRYENNLLERLKVHIEYGTSEDELVFSSSRRDEREAFQIGVNYTYTRSFSISSSYIREERSSNQYFANYSTDIFMINITFTTEEF